MAHPQVYSQGCRGGCRPDHANQSGIQTFFKFRLTRKNFRRYIVPPDGTPRLAGVNWYGHKLRPDSPLPMGGGGLHGQIDIPQP